MSLDFVNDRSYQLATEAMDEFVKEFHSVIISDTVKNIINKSTPIDYNDETGEAEIADKDHLIELSNMIGNSARDLTNDAIKGQIIKTEFGENEVATNYLDSVSQAAESLVKREGQQRFLWFIEQVKRRKFPDSTENYSLFTEKLKETFKNKTFTLEGLEQLSKIQLELAKSFEEENIVEEIKKDVETDIENAEIRQNEIVSVMQEVQDTVKEYDDEIEEKEDSDIDFDTEPIEETEDNKDENSAAAPSTEVAPENDTVANQDVVNENPGESSELFHIGKTGAKENQADKIANKIENKRAANSKEDDGSQEVPPENLGESGETIVSSAQLNHNQMAQPAETTSENEKLIAINEEESYEDLSGSIIRDARNTVLNRIRKSKENDESQEVPPENPGEGNEAIGGGTYQNRDNFPTAGQASENNVVLGGGDVSKITEDNLPSNLADEEKDNANVQYQFGPGDKENPDGDKVVNPLRGTDDVESIESAVKNLIPLSAIKFSETPIHSSKTIANYLFRIGKSRESFLEKVNRRMADLRDILSVENNDKLNEKYYKLEKNIKQAQEKAFMYDIEIGNIGLGPDSIHSKESMISLAFAKNILNRYYLHGSGFKLKKLNKNPKLYENSIEQLVDRMFTYYYWANRLHTAKDIAKAKEALAVHEEKINGAIYDLTPEDKERCNNIKNLLSDGQLNNLFVMDDLLIDFNNIFSRVKETVEKDPNPLADNQFKDKVLERLKNKNLNITESIESIVDTIIFKKGDPTSVNPPLFTSILTNLSKELVKQSAEAFADPILRKKLYTEAKVFLTIKRAAERLGLNNKEFETSFANKFLVPIDIDN